MSENRRNDIQDFTGASRFAEGQNWFSFCTSLREKSKSTFVIAVLTTLLAVAQGAPQDYRYKNYEEHHREAYFNGSAFLKLSSFVSVHRHSGLSFRTCDPGRLFLQRYNDDDSISLEVTPDGLLFVAVVDQQKYRARLSARLLDNAWHNVNLLFRLGNLTLNAAGHTQVGDVLKHMDSCCDFLPDARIYM